MPQLRQLSSLSLGLLERLSPSLWNHNSVRIHGGKGQCRLKLRQG